MVSVSNHERTQNGPGVRRPFDRPRASGHLPGSGVDKRILVLGLGNSLLSDDGVGVHVLRRLAERYVFPETVDLVEGGTIGLGLLPYFSRESRVVVVDGVDLGAPPGCLVRLAGHHGAAALGGPGTAHDVGLGDLLGAAQLTGCYPRAVVILGVQVGSTALGTDLTPPVQAQAAVLVRCVLGQLRGWGVAPRSCVAR